MKLIVLGDIHHVSEEESPAKYFQCTEFFKWFTESKYNNKDTTLLFEGDLSDKSIPHSSVNDDIHNFIERDCISENKIILQGNHDMSLSKGYYFAYLAGRGITIISKPTSMEIDNINCLLLPHYDYLQSDIKIPMYEYYNNLPEDISKQKYDFTFGHIMDETKAFGNTKLYCDLSYIETGVRVFGHDHTCDMINGGNYLGAVTLNSSNEKGRTPYIAIIDTDTKEYNLIEIPKWLDYNEVIYPNDLPSPIANYTIYSVKDSIDKKETIDYYSKQSLERYNTPFYYNEIEKRIDSNNVSVERKELDNKSLLDYYNEMEVEKNINPDVSKIVKEHLSKII
jgi:hypothetical protein